MNGKITSAEVLSEFIGRFRELVEDIMNSISSREKRQKSLQLYPQSALLSSIKIKFSTDSNIDAIEALKLIDKLIQSKTEKDFRNQLIEHKINPSQLKDFLNSITRNKLDVEITPKLASDGEVIKLLTDGIKKCLKYLDEVNYIAIDSIKIPQANDIGKVLDVVKMIGEGTPLIPENIDGLTTERQVQYYKRAAYALGLATKDNRLTTAGHFINSHSDRRNQYEILADRFESTDFGWAWMTWAQVQYMTELNSETAADFLIDSVPNLNETTAKRRASTLAKWLTELQPYHRKYKSGK